MSNQAMDNKAITHEQAIRQLRRMAEAGKEDWLEDTMERQQEEMLREFTEKIQSFMSNRQNFGVDSPRKLTTCPYVLKGVTDTPFCKSGVLDCTACEN